MCKLGALYRQADLQGEFVNIGDFINLKGSPVEFLENRCSWEDQIPPEKATENLDGGTSALVIGF